MTWLIGSVFALLVVVVWASRKGAAARHQAAARVRFEDGDNRGGA